MRIFIVFRVLKRSFFRRYRGISVFSHFKATKNIIQLQKDNKYFYKNEFHVSKCISKSIVAVRGILKIFFGHARGELNATFKVNCLLFFVGLVKIFFKALSSMKLLKYETYQSQLKTALSLKDLFNSIALRIASHARSRQTKQRQNQICQHLGWQERNQRRRR